MFVAGMWRYPVKSLAGEQIDEGLLRPNGIPGDRIVLVRGPEGVRTSRRLFQLLGLNATIDPRGRALINGHPWSSATALSLVKRAAGEDAWLEASTEETRFDILAAAGRHRRSGGRIRPGHSPAAPESPDRRR